MVNKGGYYPPSGEILKSIANEGLTWFTALSELIDNAFDANAQHVVVEVGKPKPKEKGLEFLVIQDDGDGCADLIDMVCLGNHVPHRSTQLGRYGIGAKNAMLWIGDEGSTAIVESTRGGKTRMLTCKWKEYGKHWEIPDDAMSECVASVGQRGTTITLQNCERRWPGDGKPLEKLTEDLGYHYSRAIKDGRQVQIRRIGRGGVRVLQAWTPPPLTDVVDTTIMVDGRSARVHAGIVKDGHANPKPGITYSHGFRVVLKYCALGCGDLPYGNVCGVVELDRSWHLTKNKDDIARHKEELGDAVFAVLHAMLEKAHKRGHQIQCSKFDQDINAALNEVCGKPEATAARKPGKEKPGTVKPVGTGRKAKRAERDQSGNAFKRRASRLTLTFGNLGAERGFGEASGNNIILNEADPWIAKMRKEQNRDLVLHAAFQILAVHKCSERPPNQTNIPYTDEPLALQAQWMKHPICFDGTLVTDEPANGAGQPNDNATASDQTHTGDWQ